MFVFKWIIKAKIKISKTHYKCAPLHHLNAVLRELDLVGLFEVSHSIFLFSYMLLIYRVKKLNF